MLVSCFLMVGQTNTISRRTSFTIKRRKAENENTTETDERKATMLHRRKIVP